MTTLNRLLNADNECVGYFTDDSAGRAVMQAARAEWDGPRQPTEDYWGCRSIATPIKPLELEDVEPGDGDRVDYCIQGHPMTARMSSGTCDRVSIWQLMGAASIEVQRHEVNRYRRPGKSNRSADLGGPAEAAGVLYVLLVKAPK